MCSASKEQLGQVHETEVIISILLSHSGRMKNPTQSSGMHILSILNTWNCQASFPPYCSYCSKQAPLLLTIQSQLAVRITQYLRGLTLKTHCYY